MKLIKTKAIFEIMLIISLMFLLSYNSENVNAAEKVCCTETQDGNFCQYTETNNCKEGTPSFEGTCENFANCRPGCCDLTNVQGDYQSKTCYSGVSQGVCQKQNGNWIDDVTCNVQQCAKGCCVIGSQASYTTAKGCSQLTSEYSLQIDFRRDIATEVDCTQIVINMRQGCCVKNNDDGTKTCKSGVGTECVDGGEFYSDILCSELPEDKCGQCKKHDHLSCIENNEDVYWFDSCGNREEIAKESDVTDFNRIGINPFNGDCDSAKGTICGSLIDENKEHIGCMDINCKEGIYNNPYDETDGEGKSRKYGESWCQYEGQFGPGVTLPGARSFRHYCQDGKEIVEQCKDFRDEVCVSSTVEYGNEEFNSAACVPLKTEDCGTCKTKDCCESQNRDCLWIKQEKQGIQKLVEETQKKLKNKDAEITSFNSKDEQGLCIPLVPQGKKFWASQNTESESTQESGCDIADRNVNTDPAAPIAYWVYSAGGFDFDLDWWCGANCEVYSKKYITGSNAQCGSYGDCGAKYNLAGKWSNKLESFKRECHPEDTDPEDVGLKKAYQERLENKETAFEDTDKQWYNDWKDCTNKVPDLDNFEEFRKMTKNFLDLGTIKLDDTAGLSWGNTLKNMLLLTSVATGGYIGVAALGGAIWGASYAAAAGLTGGAAAGASAFTQAALGSLLGPVVWVIAGIIVASQIVLHILGDEYPAQITTDCNIWQPSNGGDYCNLCHEKGTDAYGNEVDFTAEGKHDCTEYFCKSLGAGCEFTETAEGYKCLNECDTEESVKLPLIGASKDLKDKLKGMCRTSEEDESDQKDCEFNTLQAQPSGVLEIKDPIKANTDINISLQTCNDVNCNSQMYANCRWDKNRVQNFGEATGIFLEGPVNSYQHTLQLKANTDILPGQEYTYYVQCINKCTKPNEDGNYPATPFYEIKFKTAKSPDITQPGLVNPIPESPIYISYEAWNHSDITAVPIILTFDDRIKECRYSNINSAFQDMVNKVGCPSPSTGNAQTCTIPFKNLKEGENNFYVKCMDKADNFNVDSLPTNEGIKLIGTQLLSIDSVKCISEDGEGCDSIYQNTFRLQVTVNGGIDGTAKCGFGTGRIDVEFLETNAGINTQQIGPLDRGVATKDIYCIDKAGNWNQTQINYNLVKDETQPLITKVYTEGETLVLNTDEDAKCKYLTIRTGSYDQAAEFEGTGGKEHRTSINNNDFFDVMCSDRFNNFITLNIFVSRTN